MKVQALYSFDHGGPVTRRKILDVSEGVAKKLMARGLVRLVNTRPPQAAAGTTTQSSASPVAPHSVPQTSNESAVGVRKSLAPKKRAAKKPTARRKPWEAQDDE